MDLIALHERAVDLVLEVFSVHQGWVANLESIDSVRSLFDRQFWRERSRLISMSSQLSAPHPDAVAIADRLFGPPPAGDTFGERAVQSRNAPKFIAQQLFTEWPLSSSELDLLERVHAQYVSDSGRYDQAKHFASTFGVVAVAGKLVPAEAFRALHWRWYDWYQLVVSAIAVWVVLTLGIIWRINSRPLGRRKQVSEVLDVVLLHLRLMVEGGLDS